MRCVRAYTHARSEQVGVLGRANTCTHLLCDKAQLEQTAGTRCISWMALLRLGEAGQP